MFDVGFSELLVIAVVALIVIGPERLPRVARMAGHLLGRLQRYMSDVKADINREMQLEELRKLQGELQDSARAFEQKVHSEMGAVKGAVGEIEESLNTTTTATTPAASEPAAAATPAPAEHGAGPAALPATPPASASAATPTPQPAPGAPQQS